MAAGLTLPGALCAGLGVADSDVRACETAPLAAFCVADVLLGFVHAGFALYLQRKLFFGLQRESFQHAEGGQGGHDPSSKELMERAGHILLYDIGTCLYVFVFIGAFAFNCAGFDWIASCSREADTVLPWFAAVAHVLFAILTVNFFVLWYCALMCDDCCGFNTPAKHAPQPQHKPQGIARVIFGNTFTPGTPHHQATAYPVYVQQPTPHVMGAPAQCGQPTAASQAMYGGQAVYGGGAQPSGGGGMGMHDSRAQPGQIPGGAAGTAAKVAGNGLSLAGMGLQAAGKWIGGGQGKSQHPGRPGT